MFSDNEDILFIQTLNLNKDYNILNFNTVLYDL